MNENLQERVAEILGRADRAFAMGRWADALEDYEDVLAREANSVEARAQAGRCRLRLGRESEAVADLVAAIDGAERPDATWLVELGEAYTKQGDEDQAAANFQTALELDPNCAMAFAGMGLLYLRHRSYQMAKTALERAISLEPLDPDLAAARNNLAIAYCYLGEYERAAEELDAARRLGYPVDPSFSEMLARQLMDVRHTKTEEPS
jgi:tetratricopeptide (TPR) repeat protein